MTTCKYANGDYCEYINNWCPYIVSWKSGHANYPNNNTCGIYEEGIYNIDIAYEMRDLHASEIFRDLYSESMTNLARKRAKDIEIRDQLKENKGFWKWLFS